jgi:excisionase family DNA binding protein
MEKEPKTILTAKEAAKYLRLSLTALYARVRRGVIPAARIGKSLRFKLEDLNALLESK